METEQPLVPSCGLASLYIYAFSLYLPRGHDWKNEQHRPLGEAGRLGMSRRKGRSDKPKGQQEECGYLPRDGWKLSNNAWNEEAIAVAKPKG